MPEDKPVAASSPVAGEAPADAAKPETPAAQTPETAKAEVKDAPASESAAAQVQQKDDDDGAAKVKAQDNASSVADEKPAAQSADVADAKAEKRGGGPRRVSGVVIGNKADKTARIRIERRVKHGLYGKILRRRTHLQAHDADNKCRIGDVVILEESPRFSKTKSWRVISVTPGEGR